MVTKYSFTKNEDNCAKAYGRNLPISTKTAVLTCKALRGLEVQKALRYVDDVIHMRRPIPHTRFTDGVGHRKGQYAAGRFPLKAAQEIKSLLESAIANAANKGLAEELRIVHICAHKAASPLHQGRQRRRAMKRTHVEIVVEEIPQQSTKKKSAPKKKSTPSSTKEKDSSIQSTSPSASQDKEGAKK